MFGNKFQQTYLLPCKHTGCLTSDSDASKCRNMSVPSHNPTESDDTFPPHANIGVALLFEGSLSQHVHSTSMLQMYYTAHKKE